MFAYFIILTCVWWVVFFMALPFGSGVTAKPEVGHADSAPTNPNLIRKIIITSIISIIIAYFIHYLIEQGYMVRFVDAYIEMLNL